MSLNAQELERYGRQILVRNFGGPAQAKLKAAHIAVIGAGGIGAPLLYYLVGAGVGEITIFEDDEVSLSNLHRQILYQSEDVGTPKILQAERALKALNPHVILHLAGRFEGELPEGISLLVDGSDELATRQLANRAAANAKCPLLAASIAQWEGQVAHFDVSKSRGCYECLYPEGTDASALPSCSEAGVIGAAAGVLGSFAALEVIKIIANVNPLEPAHMLMIDGLYRETREWKITPREGCSVCGGIN